jgi:thioredoxin reductase
MKLQAVQFGTEIVPAEARGIFPVEGGHRVRWYHDGDVGQVSARAVVLAMGMAWREVATPGVSQLVALGLASYGPLQSLHPMWTNTMSALVYGGGPAAGQAALELADRGVNVALVCRSQLTMPRYLQDAIEESDSVTVFTGRIISSARHNGHGGVEAVLSDGAKLNATHMLCCAGQKPATDWLRNSCVDLNDKGRVRIQRGQCGTNRPGVYAIGDCREGSTARVGSAIGDGSMVVTEIWEQYRQESGEAAQDFETFYDTKGKYSLRSKVDGVQVSYPEYIFDKRFKRSRAGRPTSKGRNPGWCGPRTSPPSSRRSRRTSLSSTTGSSISPCWRGGTTGGQVRDRHAVLGEPCARLRPREQGEKNDLGALAVRLGLEVKKGDLSFADGVRGTGRRRAGGDGGLRQAGLARHPPSPGHPVAPSQQPRL